MNTPIDELGIHRFIPSPKEIDEISNGLNSSDSVIIYGKPGIGKTTLLRQFAKLNPLKFRQVLFFNAIEFEFNVSRLADARQAIESMNDSLVIIDGMDEVHPGSARNAVSNLFHRKKAKGVKLLASSRGSSRFIPPGREKVYRITLEGPSAESILAFVEEGYAAQGKTLDLDGIGEVLHQVGNTPKIALMAAEMLSINGKTTAKELIELFTKKLVYSDSILAAYQDAAIILPDPPKIITDVQFINTSLVEKVRRDPGIIYQLGSRGFEELVAELFDKEGYKVTLTPKTRDGGKDLLIIEQKRIGNFIIYVECKNYDITNPVGVRLVRELYGTVAADKATAGVLVTSSYFSNPAIQFTEKVKSQLSLIDYHDLKKWIDDKSMQQPA